MEQTPPYALNQAQIGGLPTISDDGPPLIAFLIMFSASALVSVYFFEHYRRQHHHVSTIAIILFLFAGERVLTCILRLIWAYRLINVRVALAAQVFMQAGVLLLYLMNLLLVKRIWFHHVADTKVYQRLRVFLGALSACTVSTLMMAVTSIIVSVYTLDHSIIERCGHIQRFSATYFLIFASVPIPLLILCECFLKNRFMRTKDFNWKTAQSSTRGKSAFVVLSTLLCLVNAGFKAGVIWSPKRSLFDPAWYHSRTCLYVFVFGTELCVLMLCFVFRLHSNLLAEGDENKSAVVD